MSESTKLSGRIKVAFAFMFIAWALAANEDLPLWTLLLSLALSAQGAWMVHVELREQKMRELEGWR